MMLHSGGGGVPGFSGPVGGIDHIGIVVQDAERAAVYYTDRLGLRIVDDEVLDEPGVRVMYLAAGPDLIQLVQPLREGPVRSWLDANGEGLHHVCLRVQDIGALLSELGDQDDAVTFRGGRRRRACFLMNAPVGVRIELTEAAAIASTVDAEAATGS
ncbi:VOC family protein [Rathayibacter sp. VKM Ac-2760]|uniref:VOC family protein n=1 Tax=Rathayibacter sp. VKM Ac-2760 TaxID=2609253 RepID=UPI001317298D|nr:VOC family protein [Rathayibacter sp. VKM Ac-2760]QHC61174.1 hypothetical protein GSU72_20835 [Rathayibacter sp. VKM Ac-2760]